MGTFNFSNMQGGKQQETQNIPREFRPAVEQAKTEPVGSYGNNKTGFWDGVKNFFSGADVDTGAGFIDETGTWNNGTKQELAKYYPTQKSAEELEKDRLGSLWDRAYKKYHYSKDDVLLEAKKSARPQTFRKMPSWLTLIIWPTHAMYIIISRRQWTLRQCLRPTLS